MLHWYYLVRLILVDCLHKTITFFFATSVFSFYSESGFCIQRESSTENTWGKRQTILFRKLSSFWSLFFYGRSLGLETEKKRRSLLQIRFYSFSWNSCLQNWLLTPPEYWSKQNSIQLWCNLCKYGITHLASRKKPGRTHFELAWIRSILFFSRAISTRECRDRKRPQTTLQSWTAWPLSLLFLFPLARSRFPHFTRPFPLFGVFVPEHFWGEKEFQPTFLSDFSLAENRKMFCPQGKKKFFGRWKKTFFWLLAWNACSLL